MGSSSPKFEVIWNIWNQPPSITISQITLMMAMMGDLTSKSPILRLLNPYAPIPFASGLAVGFRYLNTEPHKVFGALG